MIRENAVFGRWHSFCHRWEVVKSGVFNRLRPEQALAGLLALAIAVVLAWPGKDSSAGRTAAESGFTLMEGDYVSPLLFSARDIAALNASLSGVAELAGYDEFYCRVTIDRDVEVVRVTRFSGPLFRLLHVPVVAGSASAPGEKEVFISQHFWEERFASDRAVLGRTITVCQQRCTIAGVVQNSSGAMRDTAIWLPAEHRGPAAAMACMKTLGCLRGGVKVSNTEAMLRELMTAQVAARDAVRCDGVRVVPVDRPLAFSSAPVLASSVGRAERSVRPRT